ncbi:MAG: glucose-6-phosphate isomerase [Endomicrobium sp.]|jgi:glucose-6-phosphate isomerase|nr:glucose-6-phosphate isomerase [Endomicrobium sp.]
MGKLTLRSTLQWKNLEKNYKQIKKLTLRELFKDKDRYNKFSIHDDNIRIIFDYSKNIITSSTFKLLIDFVKLSKVNEYARKMFSGEKINLTEKRAVLHTALRNRSNNPVYINGNDVMSQINSALLKMKKFSNNLRNGRWFGATGKKIVDIVNIGIGGSCLGPKMVCEALKYYADGPSIYFVSNVDGTDIYEVLKKLNPETTLFMIASKTFTTLETVTNALTARSWLTGKLGIKAIANHFVALSTNTKKVLEFGIDRQNIFELWDFVNGRCSLWASIGLSIACFVGFDKFVELLEGAHYIDQHFLNTPYEKNIPVIMAALGFWYNNFFGASAHAVLPYSQYLHVFSAYLQQNDMESNGKAINFEGKRVTYETGPIILGDVGTNCQHSFYQLFHQGTKLIPCDFIGFINPLREIGDHHEKLMASYFAQPEALAFGFTRNQVSENLKAAGFSSADIKALTPHKVFEGNKPSNSILIDKLTPKTLGALIALYEHKIFVQGIMWCVNSFDQFGVELGKTLADGILPELKGQTGKEHDNSTKNLIKLFNLRRNNMIL